MQRMETFPGLQSGLGWTEYAYDTGDAVWPVARVRVTPELADQDQRLYAPSGAPVPQRVAVLMSASLVDAQGQVRTIAGRLLLGPEMRHSYQFVTDAPFDPIAWLDAVAAATIAPLIRLANGLTAALAAGLLPPLPDPEEPPAGGGNG